MPVTSPDLRNPGGVQHTGAAPHTRGALAVPAPYEPVSRSDSSRTPRQAGGRKGPWSHPEIEKLKRMYGLKDEAQIARLLGRTPQSVKRMVHKVFAGERRSGPWTAREVVELKKYLGAADVPVIARILRRTEVEVERRIHTLQESVRPREWTSSDLQRLKRLYGTRSTGDLSLILGQPVAEIERKAEALCLAKDKGYVRRSGTGSVRMPRWSREEKERLRRLYPDTPNLEIARLIGRSEKSIVSKAHDLGLRKSSERLRQMGQENVAVRYDNGAQAGGGAELSAGG